MIETKDSGLILVHDTSDQSSHTTPADTTHSKGSPSVDSSIVSKGKGNAIACSNFDNLNTRREFDFPRVALTRVEARVVIIITSAIALIFINVFQSAVPFGRTSQGLVIIHTPGQDSAVRGQCQRMHATSFDIDHSHVFGPKQRVKSRALDIDSLLRGAETEFRVGAFTTDKDIEDLCWALVDFG